MLVPSAKTGDSTAVRDGCLVTTPDRPTKLTIGLCSRGSPLVGVCPRIPPTELTSPTLYECVDVEALEATLFGGKGGSSSRQGSSTVTFQYADYVVTVTSDGWVEVDESSTTEAVDESDRS